MPKVTYKKAGVDIGFADIFKTTVKSLARRSFKREVLRDIGGFGSFFRFPKEKFKDPVLVSSADGVGTKLKIAILADRHDTIGIDAVAMNVNDILCTGARPLFFLDYIGFSKLKSEVLKDIIKGINDGCIASDCSLIGGETAQMPGMYKPGEYDVAGFCVGAVERSRIIDGSTICEGDVLVGLESNGLHSNGFSLVRKVFSRAELESLSKELLKPTRIYVRPVLSLLQSSLSAHRSAVKGIAHITGGAFYDKIARILPASTNAKIKKGSWIVPKIFRLLQQKGRIEDREMYHTFNMGIGLVLIIAPGASRELFSRLSEYGIKAWVIGEVSRGKKQVEIV
ncbi:MAG: phosphoribosylformylglycinamidine cyclo-ligase [Candidatus Omnitrophota bacterium]|jgi:phosphoribosylformylglycinamidine cyclo-ligase|nr:MAG: phosphoribosylformylglycinamidine cyclo-ligase [Candidatus Omnitrophota bacterium]